MHLHVFCLALTGRFGCSHQSQYHFLMKNLTGQTGPYLSFHLQSKLVFPPPPAVKHIFAEPPVF